MVIYSALSKEDFYYPFGCIIENVQEVLLSPGNLAPILLSSLCRRVSLRLN